MDRKGRQNAVLLSSQSLFTQHYQYLKIAKLFSQTKTGPLNGPVLV